MGSRKDRSWYAERIVDVRECFDDLTVDFTGDIGVI